MSLITDDGATVLAYNENIDPDNLFDDAQITVTLPYTGTFYLKVDADLVWQEFFAFFGEMDSYGSFDITLMRAPTFTDFDSDRNVGPAPLSTTFFSKCTKYEDLCVDIFNWDLMVGSHGGRGVAAYMGMVRQCICRPWQN